MKELEIGIIVKLSFLNTILFKEHFKTSRAIFEIHIIQFMKLQICIKI